MCQEVAVYSPTSQQDEGGDLVFILQELVAEIRGKHDRKTINPTQINAYLMKDHARVGEYYDAHWTAFDKTGLNPSLIVSSSDGSFIF